MKDVLISIKGWPWGKIVSGEKTIEVRKSAPKDIKFPFKAVCYQSGKGIVGQFICDSVEKTHDYKSLSEGSCLTPEECFRYANGVYGRGDLDLYGWKIQEGSAVEYDEVYPVEMAGMSRPPQSWAYIPVFEENKRSYSFDGIEYNGVYNNTAEALAEALNDIKSASKYDEIPEKVFVGKCVFFKPSLRDTGYDIIDHVQCQADDAGFGEWADDYLTDVTKEMSKDLEEQVEAVFQKWLDKYNLHAGFFSIPEYEVYHYDGEKLVKCAE